MKSQFAISSWGGCRRREALLSDAIAPALETGVHGALILRALRLRLLGRHAAVRLSWIKSGLRGSPRVALVFVVGLLPIRLSIPPLYLQPLTPPALRPAPP